MSSPQKVEWMKPGDVLQKLKAKKRALKARINQGIRKQALESSQQLSCFKGSNEKRTNPFKCGDGGAAKRSRLEPSAPEPSLDQTLFEILRSGAGDVRTAARAEGRPAAAAEPFSFTRRLPGNGPQAPAQIPARQAEQVIEETPKGVAILPTDWGLKTKIRFLSKTPFPWTSRLKTLEEASAVTSCVRCLPADQTTLDTSPNAQLQRHAFFWQHPWLPWLPLFPRLHSRATGPRSLFTDPPMQDKLRTEWGESLRSLFQLLRSRQCPFFYVCAASFCCLFRAAGVGGVTDTHAVITPTTRGLRDLLKKDDVQFTLPLRGSGAQPGDSSSSPAGSSADLGSSAAAERSSSEHPELGEDGEDGSEDEDPEHWLERMGIQADSMPGMHSTRRKLQQETGVDGRPASTALVQGGDVYSLLNFLLNSRACVAVSGPLAGVPPTLLAPVGFQGAALQPLKVRHGAVQQGRETFHTVELAGPVMPHAVRSLVALVRRSQPEFSASLAGVRGAEPLSQLRPPEALSAPAVFGQQGLADCGLDADTVEALCQPQPAVLREVTCRDGLFTW